MVPFSLTPTSLLLSSSLQKLAFSSNMAHHLLFCFVIANAIVTLATARPFAVMLHTTAVQLHGHGGAHPPLANGMELGIGGAPEMALHPKHRPSDKSIAGAEVILGGLATAIFAAIFCYIRVTRQRDEEEKS